jgi:hypothetical protein
VAVAGDVALALLPRRRGLLLVGLDHGGAFAVAFAARELDALLVDRGGVAERPVVGVEHVLDLELPVAVVDVAMHAGVERELAVGGAVDEVVDTALHRADMVLEARALRREACEHEAAIFANARRAGEAECRRRNGGAASSTGTRPGAVGAEGPAVIAAHERGAWPRSFTTWRRGGCSG